MQDAFWRLWDPFWRLQDALHGRAGDVDGRADGMDGKCAAVHVACECPLVLAERGARKDGMQRVQSQNKPGKNKNKSQKTYSDAEVARFRGLREKLDQGV